MYDLRKDTDNGIITIMRGDYFQMPILINVGTKLIPEYVGLIGDEKLYFGIMEPHQAFEDAIVKKVFTSESPVDKDGNVILEILPEDTLNLLVGKYYYMIKLRYYEDNVEKVKTITTPTLFWIMGSNVEEKEKMYYQKGKYIDPSPIVRNNKGE